MSDLQPRGIKFDFDGRQFELLFTISAIDEIQETCNLPLPDAMQEIAQIAAGEMTLKGLTTLRAVLAVLLNASGGSYTESAVGAKLTRGTCVQAAWDVLTAYAVSMPEPDEDDDDDDNDSNSDDRAVNIARLLYIGCVSLGHTEAEVFSMTLRKFYLLFDEYLDAHGIRKKEDESLLDAF